MHVLDCKSGEVSVNTEVISPPPSSIQIQLNSRVASRRSTVQFSPRLSATFRQCQYNKLAPTTLETVKQEQPLPPPPPPDSTNGFLKQIKLSWLQKKFSRNLRATITRTTFIESHHMSEQWMHKYQENQDDEEDETILGSSPREKQSKYLLSRSSSLFAVVEILGFFVHVAYWWYLSVVLVMEGEQTASNHLAGSLWLTLQLIYTIFHLNTEKVYMGKSIKNRANILKKYLIDEVHVDLICVIMTIINMVVVWDLSEHVIVTVLLLFLIPKIRSRYRNVEDCLQNIMGQGLFKLLHSFMIMAFFAHACALGLYMASLIEPENSWLSHITFLERNWLCDYLYSLYWAITTIVTVGFGDIGPKNKYEILIVIVLEILGTSFFGYMINVIGITLSDLQKERETFETTLKTADRLSQCFGLDSGLTYRLRKYLKDNQRVDTLFNVSDENRIMQKLSPSLQKEVLQATNFQVIEKCMFFLTYFNIAFLSEMSLKLVKRIVQPGEQLLVNPVSPKMYIVDTGTIDIQAKRKHRNKTISKKARTISRESNKSVSNNLYGYVVLLTGSNQSQLTATSRTFSFVYELSKEDFFDCVQPGSRNYQTVCELKHRFSERRLIDEIEAPQITDPFRHYAPTLISILTKQKMNNSIKQPRLDTYRRKALRTNAARTSYECLDDSSCFQLSGAGRERGSRIPGSDASLVLAQRKQTVKLQKLETIAKMQSRLFMDIINGSYDNHVIKRDLIFETGKDYSSYMVNNNLRVVLQRWDTCQNKKQTTRFNTSYLTVES